MGKQSKLQYEIIFEDLKSRIIDNEFQTNNKLPTEFAMAEYYHCSRPTIRKAIRLLAEEEMVISAKGSGHIVIYEQTENHKSPIHLVGLIMQNLGSDYIFDSLCNTLANRISDAGYSLLYGAYIKPNDDDIWPQIKRICNQYIKLHVSGVFFTPFEYTEESNEINDYVLSTLSSANIAVVLIDSDISKYPETSKYDIVSLDHINACYLLTEHLVKQGGKKIVFFFPPNSANTIDLRKIGFLGSLHNNNLPIDKDYCFSADPTNETVIKGWYRRVKPDAIICSNDGCAYLLANTLLKLGLKIPEDILIAGFDNMPHTSLKKKIKLTSIAQPIEAISTEAVSILFRRIKNPDSEKVAVRFPGKLIIRQSTIRN